ncbi:RTA-like protein [Aspergillus oryzae]|uniref:RTA-like protein n=1 Tax=Aspergillus oryzae TaxID=5062 RepID=A0A1S9DCU0_ASPOZ|nr:RTA-like protein [Aspergillus oryzae]
MSNSWHGQHLACHPVIDGVRNLYGYQPSLAAGVFFSILFTILMILHVVHCIRRKTWWCMVFAIGCLVEVLGWAARTWSAKCPYTKSAFLMQLATLVIAPTFFSAGIYLLLGYIIRIFGRKSSYFRSDCYFWFFTVCDLISLVVQAVGGALASAALSAHRDMSNGTHIMIAGIAFQMASTLAFATCMVDCVLRTIHRPRALIPSDKATWLRSYADVANTIGRSVGAAVGFLFTKTIGWRWCFYSNVPLILLCAFIVVHQIPPDSQKSSQSMDDSLPSEVQSIDWAGIFTLTITLVQLILFIQTLQPGQIQQAQTCWAHYPLLPLNSMKKAFGGYCLSQFLILSGRTGLLTSVVPYFTRANIGGDITTLLAGGMLLVGLPFGGILANHVVRRILGPAIGFALIQGNFQARLNWKLRGLPNTSELVRNILNDDKFSRTLPVPMQDVVRECYLYGFQFAALFSIFSTIAALPIVVLGHL